MTVKSKPEYKYKIYRKFITVDDNGQLQILRPGQVMQCTELTAMCINTLQPMTARKLDNDHN